MSLPIGASGWHCEKKKCGDKPNQSSKSRAWVNHCPFSLNLEHFPSLLPSLLPKSGPQVAAMFVHLHCHSHYSFLRGVNPPEEIIAAAVEQKMPAVALTDTDGMYAAVPFYQAARAAKINAIIGVVLDVEFCQTSD